jgi:menaquinol-cytochrome c reductase iron-sulfur subunit
MVMADPIYRRRFLDFLTKVLMTGLGLAVAIPAIGYFVGPLLPRRDGDGAAEGFADAGRLGDIPIGGWHLVSFKTVRQDGWKKSSIARAIWVRRQGNGQQDVSVLSSICPHLGCPINWHPGQAQFLCPCHGGIFQSDGEHISGPPPRSMDTLDFEIRTGRLWVRWQDFKIGIAQRIPVRT